MVPFDLTGVIADVNIGLVLVLGVGAGTRADLAGWSKLEVRIVRRIAISAQMVSYEVAMGLSLIGALCLHCHCRDRVGPGSDSIWYRHQPVGHSVFDKRIAENNRAPLIRPRLNRVSCRIPH